MYYESKINEIDFNSPKKTWKQLKRIFNLKNNSKQSKPQGVEIGQFFNMFKDQNSNDNELLNRDFVQKANTSDKTVCLNCDITQDEISSAITRFKKQ